jgi:hypothetical protein
MSKRKISRRLSGLDSVSEKYRYLQDRCYNENTLRNLKEYYFRLMTNNLDNYDIYYTNYVVCNRLVFEIVSIKKIIFEQLHPILVDDLIHIIYGYLYRSPSLCFS